MKHAMSAVVALVFGIGLAAAAQAHGISRQSAAPNPNIQQGAATGPQHMSRRQIEHTQRMLKAEGLYKGRIDGIMGLQTRLALTRQQQRGPNHRASIDQTRRNVAARQRNAGVGSSMSNNPSKAGGNNQNGTTGNPNKMKPQPVTPPATQAPGAGGNAPGSNPNTSH